MVPDRDMQTSKGREQPTVLPTWEAYEPHSDQHDQMCLKEQ